MNEYVIWDFNGTILDDTDLCVEIENKMRVARGYPLMTAEHYRSIFRFPIEDYYRDAGVELTDESYQEIAHEFVALYQPASLKAPLRRGVADTIKALKEKGRKQILLSASQKDNLLAQIEAFGIRDLFDTILGLEDIFGRSKVDMAVRWFTAKGAHPDSAVMIGDTIHDYEVAQAMGCRCLLLTGGHNSRDRLAATGTPVLEDVTKLPEHPWLQ